MLSSPEAPARRQPRITSLLGPAFVAAIAYVDPGNVAANLSAGAEYGYLLLWVLVLANLMAALVQYLSAKLALVTGRSLTAELAGRLPRVPRWLYWGQAEIIVAATDIAEVIGGAVALHLLFGTPLLLSGLIVSAVSLAMLALQGQRTQRSFEAVIVGFLAVITLGFVSGLFVSGLDLGAMAQGLVPRFQGTPTVLLAASMLGATVMPHAICLHSGLVRDHRFRPQGEDGMRHHLRATKVDVGLALTVAGSVNIAMLCLAAQALRGVEGTDTIEGAHQAVTAHLGAGIGVIFAIGLLASGLASTSVGCYAGDMVMRDLLHFRVPLLARRCITLVPALIILASGAEPTWALVLSQVVLSIGIPFALIPLAWLTSRARVMGRWANPAPLNAVAAVVCAAIVALNIALIWLTLTGQA
ncbi:Nramp family divalent metal transporter [Corynebacterium mastitidis]|uniref:Divalent metal cation transporter n=1 Tax=Corynebacterium mastitidis TaxID=161890 RepID=A0A2N0X8Z1_9CORY|nr:Nramp family divalent metal transporter [Corynebacterium mastitidis]MCH6196426.1 Nramp family divalent metal transporter [Corynebacterium mastitidis]PKF69186.1 divalent metal cation transporter [Corynebacterium mastitidis]